MDAQHEAFTTGLDRLSRDLETSLSQSNRLHASLDATILSSDSLSRRTAVVLAMVNTAADTIQVLESGHRSLITSVKNISFLTESLTFRVETGLEKLNASLSDIQSNSLFSRGTIEADWLAVVANRASGLLWTWLVSITVISPRSTIFALIRVVLGTCRSLLSALMAIILLFGFMVKRARAMAWGTSDPKTSHMSLVRAGYPSSHRVLGREQPKRPHMQPEVMSSRISRIPNRLLYSKY
ncbi:hypothetical protein FA15DRAFT_43916 [Coprinopsis marcescibilis]|uniref:Uncharacterized protein n=1 Tax=Coprinopsis marcescibilis TaxID=230819 RepID=A0A5C3L7B0_COPMA|nr:hypothetical protein FA15DRAFT_43916 [Coprinopsis marcescibilis]